MRRASGLLVPIAHFAPGYPCCCPEPEPCIPYCSGSTPAQYDVTLDYFADDYCTDCDETYNDTFTLDLFDLGAPQRCYWRYVTTLACGGKNFTLTVQMWFGVVEGNYYLLVNAGVDTDNITQWRNWYGENPPNCALQNESVAFELSIDSYCEGSSATCQVSAVP